MKRFIAAAAVATVLVLAPAAQAAAPCPTVPEVRVLADGFGRLESVAINPQGRLYFTESEAGQLLSLRKPGAKPKVVTDGIEGPGGIVFQKRHVLVGFGDSIEQGADGAATPEAGILRVGPETGKSTIFASGLQMANGVARSNGVLYASTDFGTGIDRISNKGADVKINWASLTSPNGIVVDSSGKYLYAAQTFTSSAIQRISIADPTQVTPAYTAPPEDISGGFDGLARDGKDNLYVAANLGGQILKITGPTSACSLAELPIFPEGPSALAFGRGDGKFSTHSLFVVTFAGQLLELRNVR
jgi:sugar lactone lactonase YvrE